MADEAVVRIVLDDASKSPTAPGTSSAGMAPPPGQAEAMRSGTAMPWAPRSQPIPLPAGIRSDQAEFVRLEAEAARHGLSVRDYKKLEMSGGGGGMKAPPTPIASVPPPIAQPAPSTPKPPALAAPAPPVLMPPTPPPPLPPPIPQPQPRDLKDLLRSQYGLATPEPEAAPQAVQPTVAAASFEPHEPSLPTPAQPLATATNFEPVQAQPIEVAKKRVETERKRRAVDEEYAKLKPPVALPVEPPFDPVMLAKKRIKSEEQRRAIDAEYAKLKPKSIIDTVLDAAESLRGTIGGVFGTLAGAALDVASNIRKASTKAVSQPSIPKPEGAVSSPPLAPAAVSTPPTTTPSTATLVDDRTYNAPQSSAVAADFEPQKATPMSPTEAPKAEVPPSTGAVDAASGISKLGVAAAVAAAAIVAFGAVVGEANKMVEKYGEYSPEIAQAQAMAEITEVMGNMRRAQESGKELANFVEAQTEAQQRWEDIKVSIMTKILPIITGILRVLGGLLGIASRTNEEEIADPTTVLLSGRGIEVPEI